MSSEPLPTATLWSRMEKKLAGRKVTLNGRDILSAEKDVLRALIGQARDRRVHPAVIAEKLDCSRANVYQFFTGQHGVSLRALTRYCSVLGLDFLVTIGGAK